MKWALSFRFGLGWKIGGLLGCLILVLFATYAYLNHRSLNNYFTVERQSQSQLRSAQLEGMLANMLEQLQVLSQNRLSQVGLNELENDRLTETSYQNMSTFWSDLRNNLGYSVDSLMLFDSRARYLDSWGYQTLPLDKLSSEMLYSPVARNYIHCSDRCYLVAVVPYRFSSGLAVVQRYSLVYVIKLNQLMPVMEKKLGSTLFTVRANGEKLELLESTFRERQPLKQLLSDWQVSELENKPVIVEMDKRALEMRLSALPLAVVDNDALFIGSLVDIDGVVKAVGKAQAINLVFGFVALFVLLISLLLVLRGPLLRVRKVIAILPQLAQSRYRDVHNEISSLPKTHFADETDDLANAASQLTDQLESMEKELTHRAEELEWLASHDSLTRLINRRQFEILLGQRLLRDERGCLFFIDLDNFKYINDYSGHNVGDRMLRAVSGALEQVLSPNVLCARFGGDEFAFYLPGVCSELAEMVAARVVRVVSQLRIGGKEQLHSASASLGIVAYPEQGRSLDELLAHADLAMYQAKQQGKNCYSLYQRETIKEDSRQRGYWLEQARRAIDQERLTLVFQPIQGFANGQNSHYEVLLRFKDDSNRLVSAYPLIVAAEDGGYISRIDLFVIENAVQTLLGLPSSQKEISLSINLSGRSFADPRVMRQIEKILEESRVDCRRLIFEITETAALNNLPLACEAIDRLKSLGCRFALDDFGVGFSSFHTLKELPVDYIKIDGSFVRELLNKPSDRVFIKALVEIAGHFGYQTIAEYVENAALYEVLKELGIDYAQGYYVGKPAPMLHTVQPILVETSSA
ncbi:MULTISPECIES: putative bifunctional diguanylate cyclase/phosphodiesterase [Corallincola]|uniref:Bifunctional diguanylate cyclase/phosphodiesterase n=3 Tax=Corallincola TaxID=1775176 RepID=A0A368NMX2_9GAMM|nr:MULTISPECIES: bifunctional diguanylate cyclase/phosphodiesterase [Corallincola]RCU51758.1 bifunctional diguanylate cyclase/phosphodiesterase [Corallincola holothuriorum]TAA47247.1 bifunctional diguanylate cyclase/phosphodiesterase [Corallincola spongiicola]TCI04910.1 bifunctional diguanylate cyclase/phosphodiesterase [Corallincola luteus]